MMNKLNPDVIKTNDNEVVMNNTENCVNNVEDCTFGTQKNTNFVKNAKENSNMSKVTNEKYSQKFLFGMDTNVSSAIESNSNVHSKMETFDNRGSNENYLPTVGKEEKYINFQLDCQHKETVKELNTTDNLISANSSINTEEMESDNAKLNFENKSSSVDECLPAIDIENDMISTDESRSTEVQLNKPQPISSSFHIVPNPNEFNLVGKSNLAVQNTILKLNQSTHELLALSDNSVVISNSNAIPQSDSIVSSNYSLSQLQVYFSDDEEDNDSVIEEVPVAPQQYREGDQQMEDSEDSDSSTSSSTSIIMSDSSSESESDDEYENFSNKPVYEPIRAKGEMDLNDLPPIEDLAISVPEEECIPIGKIYQIVEQLVIVQANKDTPAYDLDTVLFTQGGKPLGKVFDVMGPVTEPYYCIRFNSKDHIKEKNITLDQTVYAAPKTQYSKFVFLTQLMQLKGSDASWENDHEPPEIYLDYSDDEQEQRAKKKHHRNKKAVLKTDSDPDEPARKRHSAYVKRMNARNLRLSAARGNQSLNKNKVENGKILWQPNLPSMMGASPPFPRAAAPCHRMFGKPPLFDMRVPPPSSSFPSYGDHRPEFGQIFSGPSTSSRAQEPPSFPRPPVSPIPPPFIRPCISPGPPPFPRPCVSQQGASNCPRMSQFPPPPPYCRLPNNQELSPTLPGWRPAFSNSDNTWVSPFPPPPFRNAPPVPLRNAPPPPLRNAPPPPLRGAPPPPIGSYLDFPGSFPNRASSSQGPQFNVLAPWPNSHGNSPQFNFNPAVPPPSPNFFPN